MEHAVKHLASFQSSKDAETVVTELTELRLVPDSNLARVEESVKFAMEKYTDFVNSLDLDVLEYTAYGREFIKTQKFSPDSWIQLAINLAYYRVHGESGGCYESASTRKFAYGRTETIRSASTDVTNFCKNPSTETLKAAINSHKMIVKDSLNGQGIDRVMLGKLLTKVLLYILIFIVILKDIGVLPKNTRIKLGNGVLMM